MTDFIEKEGKSVEAALEKASEELGVSQDDLVYEILEETDRSFIGIGIGKKVKIRAAAKSTGSVAADAKKTLSRLLELMRIEAVVNIKENGVYEEEEVMCVNLEIIGDGSGLLIGKHGATLDAIQYITNKMINHKFSGGCNIRVDSENYRSKREESLTQLAMRLGEKAKKIRKPVSLNPLSARDRKTIHMALKEDRDVETRSSGTGILKRVVIIPAKLTASEPSDSWTQG